MNFRIITAYVTSLLCSGLFAQSVPRAQPMPTFHIQGTVSSPWDSLLRGQAIPRSSVTFSGEQAIRNLGSNDKDSYISVPNTEITFRGEQATKTVTVDDKGFYQADLPVGLYKMTAHGPTIHTQPLTEYVRLFRVQSPTTIVLNGSLHMARTNCDVVANSDTPELHTEELKDNCGGEDSLPIPSKEGVLLELRVRYPERQLTRRGYRYGREICSTQPEAPVFVSYDLFSLEAKVVYYDAKNHTIVATGNVVTEDGSGKARRADAMAFRIEDGHAISLN